MNFSNKLPSFELTPSDLCCETLDLFKQTDKSDSSKQPLTYQGMSVQMLDTPFPIYHHQSDITENNDNPLNLLNNHDIEPLTLLETADFSGTDITDIPKSVFDEYITWNSKDPVNDPPSPIPNISLIQHICLSGSEPEIREATPAGHSNPDNQLTNLPVRLSKPQDLRPVTVANSLNLSQTTSDNQTAQAKEIVNDKSSIIEHQRERYQNVPDFAECERKHKSKPRRNPADLERHREYMREYMRERRKDPTFIEQERKSSRDRYRNNPDYRERQKELKKQLCKDPAYLERKRERNRLRYWERRKNPAYTER